eukprot:839544-Pelagomonas_calceolata.AAC.2
MPSITQTDKTVTACFLAAGVGSLCGESSLTGVLCVWKPVIVFGRPAWATTSTAWPTRTGMGSSLPARTKASRCTVCVRPSSFNSTPTAWPAHAEVEATC